MCRNSIFGKTKQGPNCNSDKTKKANCDKTQIAGGKINKKLTQLINSNSDKTKKLKQQQNSKPLVVTKLKNSNCDKSLILKQ